MYYEYQRWYDPTIGRFISQDPLWGDPSNPQSLNRYVYVSNRPTVSTDPTGRGAVYAVDSWSAMGCSKDFWGWLRCQLSMTPVGDVVVPADLALEGAGWLGPVLGRITLEDVIDFGAGAMVPGGALATKVAWDVLTSPHVDVRLDSDVNENLKGDWGTNPITASNGGIRTPKISLDGMNQGGKPWAGSRMEWSLGFSNGYVRNLRKAIANPILHSVCWGGTGLAAVALWSYESAESARQNIGEQPDPWDIFGGLLLGCYGASAVVYSVMGSF